MHPYEPIFHALNWPLSLIEIALGKIEIPIVGWHLPAAWYCFPPALIPVASEGSGPSYLGYWKHWFSNREPTFVIMYVDSGRTVVEIARTPMQLYCYMAITAITDEEGITSTLEKFAKIVGLSNLPELDSLSKRSGDNPRGFSALREFAVGLPLRCVESPSDYTGDFPTERFLDSTEKMRDVCSFELSHDILSHSQMHLPLPQWFNSGNKKKLFDELMTQGDLRGAWMTLNSTGWAVIDAKAALSELANAENDPLFKLLTAAWVEHADVGGGSY